MNPHLSIAPIDEHNVADLRSLLTQPPEGWCWCVAWEVPTWVGWSERSAEENRALREGLWSEGQYQAYLFLCNREPIGWCRVGPTNAWPKLVDSRQVSASDTLHAFTCFGLRPEYRRRGYLLEYVHMVIEHLQAQGVREFVAFPRPHTDGDQDPGQLWNGPLSVFLRAGFRIARETPAYIEVRLSSIAAPRVRHLRSTLTT